MPIRSRALAGAAVSSFLVLAVATQAEAQERLVGASTGTTGAFFENWSLPTAVGATTQAGGSVMIAGASQITLPVAVVVPVAPGWTVDAYGAYVRSEVRLASPDANGRTKYRLDGPTDARIRVVGQLIGESLLLTAGVSAPTGRTKLNATELSALSVISAPGLRFRSPFLGAGAGATLGLIVSRPMMGWGVALGTSYEARGTYAPAEALAAGQSSTNLRPGNAAHLSLAFERLFGSARHLLNVGGDFYQAGELSAPSSAGSASSLALGPSVTGSYEIDATLDSWESTAFVVGRHRAEYRLAGEPLAGSSRTEFEGGLQGYRALSPSLGLRLGLEGRMHSTGVIGSAGGSVTAPDVGFTTAGVTAGGGTVALRLGRSSSSLSLEPFVRAQVGSLDFSSSTATVTGFSGGATLTARF